jgi:hypothetical protein
MQKLNLQEQFLILALLPQKNNFTLNKLLINYTLSYIACQQLISSQIIKVEKNKVSLFNNIESQKLGQINLLTKETRKKLFKGKQIKLDLLIEDIFSNIGKYKRSAIYQLRDLGLIEAKAFKFFKIFKVRKAILTNSGNEYRTDLIQTLSSNLNSLEIDIQSSEKYLWQFVIGSSLYKFIPELNKYQNEIHSYVNRILFKDSSTIAPVINMAEIKILLCTTVKSDL